MEQPPAWATTIAIDDLDEARVLFADVGSHRREALGRGPLGMRWSIASLEGAAIGWGFSRVGQVVHAVPRVHLVHVPFGGPLSYRIGLRHFDAEPGQVVYVGAGTEYTVAYGGGASLLAIQLEGQGLPSAIQGASSRAGDGARLPAYVLNRAMPGMAGIASMLRDLRSERSAVSNTPVAQDYRQRLAAWTAQVLGPASGTTDAGRVAEARLRRVEEWIDAHLPEPISLAGLSEVAGIEPRSLRKSFRQRRGVAPMQWVFERRMAAARVRLMTAVPGVSVTRIAHECGLPHAGRFSTGYRSRYGEKPSFTLALAAARR